MWNRSSTRTRVELMCGKEWWKVIPTDRFWSDHMLRLARTSPRALSPLRPRRIHILIDTRLDEEVRRLAVEKGLSKSALIRGVLRMAVHRDRGEGDPLDALAGAFTFEPLTHVDQP